MSLLDNLIEFSNCKSNGQRASSLSIKSRLGDEEKNEQPNEGRTSSKSLSKGVKITTQQLAADNNVMNFSKSLYKLIFIMNKKMRNLKFHCFTKLECHNKKRLWKSDSLKNLQKLTTSLKKISSGEEQEMARTMPQLPKPPSTNKNAQAIRKLVETYNMLYLKYFSGSQKQRIFSRIKKFSQHMNKVQEFIQPVLKHLEFCTYENKRNGLQMIKDHEKQYLRLQLLIDCINSFAGKSLSISHNDLKRAFTTIQQQGIRRVNVRLQEQKLEIQRQRQRLAIFSDNSLEASRDSKLSLSKLSLQEDEKSEAERQAEKALKRYAQMQKEKNRANLQQSNTSDMQINISSNPPSSTDFQLQIQHDHEKFMRQEEQRVRRQQEEIKARQQIDIEKAKQLQQAIIQKQREQMQQRQQKLQMARQQAWKQQMIRDQMARQQMLMEKQQEAIRLQMQHEEENHRRLEIEREEQRMRKTEEQQKMRMKQLEEERQVKSRQKQSEQQRIRERLEEQIKIRQRLQQELRNRERADEENRKRRFEEEKRYREQSHSRQKSRSTAIDSHTQQANELNRNYSQSQLRRHQTEYEVNSPGITRTTLEDHRPTNFIKQNKAIDDRAVDHHSLGRYSSSQRSQTVVTPRIQSEAGLPNEYFSRETDTRRQDSASNQKPRRDVSHPPLSIANSNVSEMEHFNKMGQSNKKKIVLSKKNPNDDSLESRKVMTESILQKPLDTHSCSWSSQRYEVTTKLLESPIKSSLRKTEHLPRAIYRLYPDQVNKEIEDIPDNIKLFLEASDFSKDQQALQFSEVKSSFFGSESSGNMRYDGIISQMNRIKEQESMQKASKLDNPSKFTSPADFFRSNNDSRATIQRINAQQLSRPPLNTPMNNVNTQSQQLPVRDLQQGSPYLKQKFGNLGLSQDKFQQPSRPTDPLYISRKIKQACMDGRREEDYKEMSEKRKRTDSQTRVIRLTEPSKPAFDKSCSSDTKLRSMQMARPVNNPGAFTLHPQNTISSYELSNTRRPNSQFGQFHRVTFDLNKVPLNRDSMPLPSTSLPVNSLSIPQYYDPMAQTPVTLSASSSTSSFSQLPLSHSTYLQSKQTPSFFQSQYYFNRSKMLAQATSANLARHN